MDSTRISTVPPPTKCNLDAEEKLFSFPAHQELYYTYSSTYPACSVSSASLRALLTVRSKESFPGGFVPLIIWISAVNLIYLCYTLQRFEAGED